MKRGNRHDRHKRQKKRNHHQNDPSNRKRLPQQPDTTSTTSTSDDIEEQLRIQRLKRKEQESTHIHTGTDDAMDRNIEDGDTVSTVSEMAVLGKYSFDPKRKAYFPTVANSHHNDDENNRCDEEDTKSDYPINMAQSFPLSPHRLMMHHNCSAIHDQRRPSSAAMISYMVQLLHGTKQRRNLIATHWYGAMLLNSMSILPTPTQMTFLSMFSRMHHNDGSRSNNHIGSALWTRGFDILPFQHHQQNSNNDANTTFDLQHSSVQCLSYQYPLIHGKVLNHQSICSRRTTATDPEYIVGCIEPLFQTTKLHVRDYRRQSCFSIIVPFEANDFTATSRSDSSNHCPVHRIVTGGNQSRCSTIDLVRMEQIEFRRRFHTKSDILCVESSDQSSRTGTTTTTDDESTCCRPDLIFFGHRNGQVQVHDMRTDVVQQIGTLAKHTNRVDSVLRIVPLFRERPDQLVARGKNCWMLFDLRRMGGSSMNISNRAAIVHSVPLSTNSNMIACKGMAIDPLESIILVPYQSKHSSSNDQFGVNVWSLDSGCYVGNKMIPTPNKRPIINPDISSVELCSTITPAWTLSQSNDTPPVTAQISASTSDTNEDYCTSTKSYGLWLYFGDPNGMYQITCNGQWNCHDS